MLCICQLEFSYLQRGASPSCSHLTPKMVILKPLPRGRSPLPAEQAGEANADPLGSAAQRPRPPHGRPRGLSLLVSKLKAKMKKHTISSRAGSAQARGSGTGEPRKRDYFQEHLQRFYKPGGIHFFRLTSGTEKAQNRGTSNVPGD